MAKGRGAAAAALAQEKTEGKTQQNGQSSPAADRRTLVKTTLFIPDVVDANLAYMSLQTQRSKADLVRQAVEQYLHENDYDPRKKPKLAPPSYD